MKIDIDELYNIHFRDQIETLIFYYYHYYSCYGDNKITRYAAII
jgi:hypothetical protein